MNRLLTTFRGGQHLIDLVDHLETMIFFACIFIVATVGLP